MPAEGWFADGVPLAVLRGEGLEPEVLVRNNQLVGATGFGVVDAEEGVGAGPDDSIRERGYVAGGGVAQAASGGGPSAAPRI
jgi:hypothetical protein